MDNPADIFLPVQSTAAPLVADRASQVGCILDDGSVVGQCHRLSMLRRLGLTGSTAPATSRYFAWGKAIENSFSDRISSQGLDVERESTIVLGDTVGHPDFVVDLGDGSRPLGVEFKTVLSVGVAQEIYCRHRPVTAHLCQTGWYADAADRPFVLIYEGVAKFQIFSDLRKSLGLPFGATTEPFQAQYWLHDSDGRLSYTGLLHRFGETSVELVWESNRIETILTYKGIHDYHETVKELVAAKDPGPEFSHLAPDGSKIPWDHLKYCAACRALKRADSWEDWIGHEAILHGFKSIDRESGEAVGEQASAPIRAGSLGGCAG